MVLAVPVEAAQLLYWNFDSSGNRLTFTTNDGVQPRAQLVFDPTRIVIDLPGTTLGRSQINQLINQDGVQEVRIGQFDAQTTRIVIELAPGYTVDPLQVQVSGEAPNQWAVQLPPIQRVETVAPVVTAPAATSLSPTAPATGATTQLERVQITSDGLFIRATGETPELELERSRDGTQITIDLPNTAIAPALLAQPQAIAEYGIEQLAFSQVDGSQPLARITLTVDEDSPNWQAIASNLGGVVLLPSSRLNVATRSDSSSDLSESVQTTVPVPTAPPTASAPATPTPAPVAAVPVALATIQAISLEGNQSQLVIEADRPLTFSSGWDQATTDYRIEIIGAQLSESLVGPQLTSDSPLLRLRVRQETPDRVVLLVQPASGVLMGELNQPTSQTLALTLGRRENQVIPVQPPANSVNVYPSALNLPAIPDGRVLVIVDPGHGGPDPGAVGIDGLQEKGVVMAISEYLTAILEEQGVQAVMTRTDDRDLGLEPRVALAEQLDADLFVSIHANAISLSRPEVNGVETYYYSSDASSRLARLIHSSMVDGTGSIDRGVRTARFHVLVNTSMPAVLVETGFVTGNVDAYNLVDPSFQQQMAQSIAQGILLYIQQNL
jgi:N-acetylmuramoyl-L-alanine amidase